MGLVIITGGSRGLGAALCDEYGARGWEVVEFSRSAPHAYSVRLDLSDAAVAAQVFEDAFERLSSHAVDEVVAISNASMLGPVGPVANSSAALVAAHLNANVVSAILFARAFVAAFQQHDCQKTFVNISSGAAAHGMAGWSLYCASKAAMENFIRSLALEQSSQTHPISAFNVNPGVMDTAMQAEVRSAKIEDFPEREHYSRLKLDGRLAQPSVIAARIADLVTTRPESGGVYSVGA